MAELTDTQQMSDAEGDAWDALHDDPNIICTCDGCNFYSPTHDPDGGCSLTTHVKAISAAAAREHVTAALDEIERRIEAGMPAVASPSLVIGYRGGMEDARLIVRGYRQERDR